MPKLQPALALVSRLLMAFIFVFEGFGKTQAYGEVMQFMESHSVPGSLLPLVIVTELVGGSLIAVGLATRWVAIVMAGFTLLTALIFHTDFADMEQLINFNKNLAIAGGFLSLAAFGGGAWSLDAMLASRSVLAGSGRRRAGSP